MIMDCKLKMMFFLIAILDATLSSSGIHVNSGNRSQLSATIPTTVSYVNSSEHVGQVIRGNLKCFYLYFYLFLFIFFK